MQKRYNTEKMQNFRDLGGYPCDGGVTAYGRAFRCGVPDGASESDIELIKALGIRRIFDLRGKNESDDYPSGLDKLPEIEHFCIPLLEVNPDTSKNKTLTELYSYSLTENSDRFASVLSLIAETDAPVMFHCFGGKDRTGLLSALILGAAGVCDEDIVADYQVSFTYLRPFYVQKIAEHSPIVWETDLSKLESRPEYMRSVLDFLRENYGGIHGYLSHIGLDEKEIARLSGLLK